MVKIVKSTFVLTLATIICTGLITVVYTTTNPVLEARTKIETDTAIKTLYPNAQNIEIIKTSKDFTKPSLINLFKVDVPAGDKSEIYFVYQTKTIGKNSSGIELLISYKEDGTLQNMDVMKSYETTGIGDVIETPDYQKAFYGQKAGKVSVDTITGATMSTSAVNQAVADSSADFLQGVK